MQFMANFEKQRAETIKEPRFRWSGIEIGVWVARPGKPSLVNREERSGGGELRSKRGVTTKL